MTRPNQGLSSLAPGGGKMRDPGNEVVTGFYAGPLSWLNWNLEMIYFVEERKRSTWRKPLRARREPTTNLTHKWNTGGIKPRPHWWKVSALTIAHPCSPKNNILLKTVSLYDAVQEFSLAEPPWIMSHYTMLYKYIFLALSFLFLF